MQKKSSEKRERYSISKKLRSENKSNDIFEIMMNKLSLEEIIALKLELANKSVGTNMYGIPFWHVLDHIVKDAILKYALAVCPSKRKAAMYLGMDNIQFFKLLNKYDIREYYNEVWGKDPNNIQRKKDA